MALSELPRYRKANIEEFVDGFKFEYDFGRPIEDDWMAIEGGPQGWIKMELPCTHPYIGRFDVIPERILQKLINEGKFRVHIFANDSDLEIMQKAVNKMFN